MRNSTPNGGGDIPSLCFSSNGKRKLHHVVRSDLPHTLKKTWKHHYQPNPQELPVINISHISTTTTTASPESVAVSTVMVQYR